MHFLSPLNHFYPHNESSTWLWMHLLPLDSLLDVSACFVFNAERNWLHLLITLCAFHFSSSSNQMQLMVTDYLNSEQRVTNSLLQNQCQLVSIFTIYILRILKLAPLPHSHWPALKFHITLDLTCNSGPERAWNACICVDILCTHTRHHVMDLAVSGDLFPSMLKFEC